MEEGIAIKPEQMEIEIEIKAEPYCYDEGQDTTRASHQENKDKNITTNAENSTKCHLTSEISGDTADSVQNNFSPIILNEIYSQKFKEDFKKLQASGKHFTESINNPGECLKQILVEENSSKIHTDQPLLTENMGHVYENGTINRVACQQCGKTFKNRAGVKKHIKYVHDSDQTVECTECLKSFKSILYLRSHIRSVHAKIEPHKCPHCDKVCLTNKKLQDHIYITHKKEEDKVDCKICGKEFKGPYNLKLHIKYVHSDQRHACHICQKSFKVDMLLQRHIKWAHPNDGIVYKCQVCNKVLSSLDGYKTHMKSVHLYKKVTCDLCKRSFKSKHTLERHLANVHYGKSDRITKTQPKKEYKCQFCDRNLVNSTSLYWHIDRFHSQNQDLPHTLCVICNRELSDYAALHRHLQSMHSIETATCKICFKEFKSPINLQNHIRITHAPPEAVQTCQLCQKTFKCNLHLRMHVLSVHDGGTYTCEICQKTFSSNKYLAKHLKSHNEARDFKCDICSKMYKNIHSVNKHKKLVHDRVKCDVCNLKQKDIEEHMRNEHPEVQYVKKSETSLNVIDEKPKRKRNRNKKSNAKIEQNTQTQHNIKEIEFVTASSSSIMNINENSHTNINLNENPHINTIKIEIINEVKCEICNKTFDSVEFDEHRLYCQKQPILEVTIKTEMEEIT